MGHYKTSITVGGKPLGKPLSWEQKLDRENALIECTVKYAEAIVKTTVFVPMGLDMLAVKKVVEPNDKSAKVDVKFTYFLTDADSVKNPPRMVIEKPEKLESPERASIRYTAYGLKVYRGQIQILPSKPSTFEAGKNYASFSTSFDKSPAEISYVALYADNYNTDIAGDIERLANKITKSSGKKGYDTWSCPSGFPWTDRNTCCPYSNRSRCYDSSSHIAFRDAMLLHVHGLQVGRAGLCDG